MPAARCYLAYAMLHINPVITPRTFHRAEVGGKYQCIAFLWFKDNRFGLCPWLLLYQHKFATFVSIIQKQNHLHGEINITIKVLVQGIVTSFAIS